MRRATKGTETQKDIRNGARSTALSLTVLLLDSRTGTGPVPTDDGAWLIAC